MQDQAIRPAELTRRKIRPAGGTTPDSHIFAVISPRDTCRSMHRCPEALVVLLPASETQVYNTQGIRTCGLHER